MREGSWRGWGRGGEVESQTVCRKGMLVLTYI